MFKSPWLSTTSSASYADLQKALNRIGEHALAAQLFQTATGGELMTLYSFPSHMGMYTVVPVMVHITF